MKTLLTSAIVAAALLVPAFMTAPAHAATVAEKQGAIQSMEAETLNKLYAERPDTRREIEDAVGYAVFSSGSLAVFWVSGGFGHGVAHDNRTNEDIYMEMATAGVGLGLGAKDYNTVFVFHNAEAFHDFTTTGLDLSAHADAAAKVGEKGDAASGAADILPGVRIYQLTDAGLMAQAMIQGTKYWRDSELNVQTEGSAAVRTETRTHVTRETVIHSETNADMDGGVNTRN